MCKATLNRPYVKSRPLCNSCTVFVHNTSLEPFQSEVKKSKLQEHQSEPAMVAQFVAVVYVEPCHALVLSCWKMIH